MSLLHVLKCGASAEIAVIGNEGILGVSVFMGGETTIGIAVVQSAGCCLNRHHSIDQQLCRWLLLSLARLPTNSVLITQELIANMLGVRLDGVTEAAGKLQQSGLIKYHRGKIEVTDRAGLEKLVCECYSVVKLEFDRLLNDILPGDLTHILGQSSD